MKYLGIDGGGSKTTFLLTDDHDKTLFRTDTGASNLNSVGHDAASLEIKKGINELPADPDFVCAGFAGAGRAENAAFYQGILQSLLPNAKISVVSDAVIAYAGALESEPGVLLVGGTGSIALGRLPDGGMIRVGGWGPHFGDEGSGFWIGREAVRAALRAADAAEQTDFPKRIAAALGKRDIGDVVVAWSKGIIGVPEIAGLFPEVLDMHSREPAHRILHEAAAHLRVLVEIAEERVGIPNCRKSVIGSVARHPMMRSLIGINFEEPRQSPEWGAIRLAREQRRNAL